MTRFSAHAVRYFESINRNKRGPKHLRAAILITSNWLFQGTVYMDWTERIFRILTEITAASAMGLALSLYLSPERSVVAGLLITHTLGWIFNCQIVALMCKLRLVSSCSFNPRTLQNRLSEAAARNSGIARVLVYGSCCRGSYAEGSDIDIRIVRKKGFIHGIQACSFALRQRIQATIQILPLDIYVFDSVKSLERMDNAEVPTDIYNHGHQENGN